MKNNQKNATPEVATCKEFIINFGNHTKAAAKYTLKKDRNQNYNHIYLDLSSKQLVATDCTTMYFAPVVVQYDNEELAPFQSGIYISPQEGKAIKGECRLSLGESSGKITDRNGAVYEALYTERIGRFPNYQSVIPVTDYQISFDTKTISKAIKELSKLVNLCDSETRKKEVVVLKKNEKCSGIEYTRSLDNGEENVVFIPQEFGGNNEFCLKYTFKRLEAILSHTTGTIRLTEHDHKAHLFEAKDDATILLMPCMGGQIKASETPTQEQPTEEPSVKEQPVEELPEPPAEIEIPQNNSQVEQLLAQMEEIKAKLRIERERERAEARAKAEAKRLEQEQQQGIRLISYSEKAVVLIGNTRPIKDKLRELGGRFNHSLNINGEKQSGWVFSAKKQGELQQFATNN